MCAGQIAIAFRANLNLTGLKMKDFLEPLPSDLDNLPAYLDVSSISLGKMSIDWEMVKRAYTFLFNKAKLLDVNHLPKDWHPRYSAIMALIQDKEALPSQVVPPCIGMVLVSGDCADEYATAAAGIVAMKLIKFKVNPEEVYNLLDGNSQKGVVELVNMAKAVVLVLSTGSLMSRSQLWLVQVCASRMQKTGADSPERRDQAKESRKSAKRGQSRTSTRPISGTFSNRNIVASIDGFEVLPVAISGFLPPKTEAYDVLFPEATEASRDVIQSIFERLPCSLSLDASDSLLDMQMQVVAALLPATYDTSTMSYGTVETEEIGTTGNGNTSIRDLDETPATFKMVLV